MKLFYDLTILTSKETIYYYKKKLSDLERESSEPSVKKSPQRCGGQTSALIPNVWVKNNDPIHQSRNCDPAHTARGSKALARAPAILPARAGAWGRTLEDTSGPHTEQQHTLPAATSPGSHWQRHKELRPCQHGEDGTLKHLWNRERMFCHLASSLMAFLQ